ncbi:unnamed protein product [Rodentolepis nana]|uniref:KH domain-containing protein n=1 Tax=Rodentolepis nana TaxID=102285 RepID=A0A0R3U0K1_RODNA|nr:unnamed protein product [Rodentolepis nana]
MSHNDAYVNAIERAKMVVSKFNQDDSHSNGSYNVGKRSADSMGGYAPPEKMIRNDKGIAAAQEAAARLNQKLGASGAPSYQQGSSDRLITTETSIPDRYVGLVIGKKGEQITSLQNESNYKVQIAQESNGRDRVVTLTGTQQQVAFRQHAGMPRIYYPKPADLFHDNAAIWCSLGPQSEVPENQAPQEHSRYSPYPSTIPPPPLEWIIGRPPKASSVDDSPIIFAINLR